MTRDAQLLRFGFAGVSIGAGLMGGNRQPENDNPAQEPVGLATRLLRAPHIGICSMWVALARAPASPTGS